MESDTADEWQGHCISPRKTPSNLAGIAWKGPETHGEEEGVRLPCQSRHQTVNEAVSDSPDQLSYLSTITA